MKEELEEHPKGIVAFMAGNHVAAMLLMLTFIIGGLYVAFTIKQETYPAFELDTIEFDMSYPGASPEEVEEGIVLAVEEEVRGLPAIKRITSIAGEGRASVEFELVEGTDPNRALQEVTSKIGQISSFPEEAERANVSLSLRNRAAIVLTLYGDLDEAALFEFSEKVRNDLLATPEISQVDVWGGRRPEVSIEVTQETLKSLGMTLSEVADAIRENAQDVPAGGIRTDGGEVLLRTTERRDFASEYESIPLVSTSDGVQVRLGDVARIVEGFEDADRLNFFNGKPGTLVSVYQSGDERPLDIARAVEEYVAEAIPKLPEGCGIGVMWNTVDEYADRLELLAENGWQGLILVLVVLGFFLSPRLAFWVSTGIPVSILGSLILLPVLGVTINMITLFGFIITLGMVVDDAIIIGENAFYHMQRGMSPLRATIRGAREMTIPIVFSVATNIIAFMPILFIPGMTGKFYAMMPLVVISVFLISLVETMLILPAHLSHAREAALHQNTGSVLARMGRVQKRISDGFEWFTEWVFVPVMAASLRNRYLTVALFISLVIFVWGYFQSGRINFTFNPTIESTRVDAEMTVPFGAPFSEAKRVADHVEAAGIRAAERMGGQKYLVGRMNIIGRNVSNGADVNLTLVPEDERNFTAGDFVRVWREEVGDVAGLETLYFEYEVGPSGSAALTVELAHPDREILEHAASDLAATLRTYAGITDVNDGYAKGKPQIDFTITPEGRSLGISADELGRQLRHAYYGAEALRQQRGRNEVKVMVRLEEAERRSMHQLETLQIRTPDGGQAPLSVVAQLDLNTAYTEINRVDGKRILNISCNVVPELVNVNKVRTDLQEGALPSLVADYPGLSYSFEGRQRDEREALASLQRGMPMVLVAIFIVLAAVFRSYLAGLVIMSCIPFAVASAVIGHVILGYDLSIVSLFGIISLMGVSVNGALVLAEAYYDYLAQGMSHFEACIEAGRRRFRPIVLTSLTTFFGLAPMILETSQQARFLVPMAISIGFGVLCASIAVLFQTLALQSIVLDVKHLVHRLEGRQHLKPETEPVVVHAEKA